MARKIPVKKIGSKTQKVKVNVLPKVPQLRMQIRLIEREMSQMLFESEKRKQKGKLPTPSQRKRFSELQKKISALHGQMQKIKED